MIYLELFVLSLMVVYIVDVSGFTTSWRTAIAHFLHTEEMRLRPLPPFDCSKCATFWACIIYTICTGHVGLFTFAFAALLSLLANPISQGLLLIREGLTQLISKRFPKP